MQKQRVPRISTRSSIPRTRANSSAEQPQRPVDDGPRSQTSYSSFSLPPTTQGQLHTAFETDFSSEFTRAKHEPDGDPMHPSAEAKLGVRKPASTPGACVCILFEYFNCPCRLTNIFRWEDSPRRGSQYSETATRSPGSSLLSHLYRPARDSSYSFSWNKRSCGLWHYCLIKLYVLGFLDSLFSLYFAGLFTFECLCHD